MKCSPTLPFLSPLTPPFLVLKMSKLIFFQTKLVEVVISTTKKKFTTKKLSEKTRQVHPVFVFLWKNKIKFWREHNFIWKLYYISTTRALLLSIEVTRATRGPQMVAIARALPSSPCLSSHFPPQNPFHKSKQDR